jgi:hypothetical protein
VAGVLVDWYMQQVKLFLDNKLLLLVMAVKVVTGTILRHKMGHLDPIVHV